MISLGQGTSPRNLKQRGVPSSLQGQQDYSPLRRSLSCRADSHPTHASWQIAGAGLEWALPSLYAFVQRRPRKPARVKIRLRDRNSRRDDSKPARGVLNESPAHLPQAGARAQAVFSRPRSRSFRGTLIDHASWKSSSVPNLQQEIRAMGPPQAALPEATALLSAGPTHAFATANR